MPACFCVGTAIANVPPVIYFQWKGIFALAMMFHSQEMHGSHARRDQFGGRTDTFQTPLGTYLREIDATPLLTADQEHSLARRVAKGDVEARDHIVRANLRLVVKIARGYVGRGLPLPDLIEEGNIGLLRAAERFDPSRGTRFSTYAAFWIRQAIKRGLLNSTKSIRLPAYMVDLLNKWTRAQKMLDAQLGRPATTEEIGRRLDVPFKRLAALQRAKRVSDSSVHGDRNEHGVLLGDVIMDTDAKQPDIAFIEQDSLRRAMQVLDAMDHREATVVRMRFGLGDHEPQTLRQIGASLGLSRERVRQIHLRAIHRMALSVGAC